MMILLAIAEPLGPDENELIENLMAKLAEGDAASMGPIYDMTRTSVYAYALSMLKNTFDAEDVLHDCYLRLFAGAGGYVPQGRPMAYIMRIARNLCIDRLNERKLRADLPDEAWESLLKTEENPQSLPVAESLARLSDDERQIVLLHAVAGFRHRETAKLMGLPLSTVLSKYSRAIKKLRKHLTERNQRS